MTKTRTDGPSTPIPNSIILDLTSSVSNLDGRIGEGFEGVKERLASLENKPPHACSHPDEIEAVGELVRSSAKITEQVSALRKWRTWIMSIVALVVGSGGTFITTGQSEDTRLGTELTNTKTIVDTHTKAIDVLEDNLHATKIEMIETVRSESKETREAVKNGHGDAKVVFSEEDLERLRPYDRRLLNRLVQQSNGVE